MSMLFLTLFILTAGTIFAFAVWPLFGGSPERARSPRASAADAKPSGPPSAHPESLEGVLVAQLTAGEITRSQYLRSIEGLAARDDRHPLAVPPEIGPADA